MGCNTYLIESDYSWAVSSQLCSAFKLDQASFKSDQAKLDQIEIRLSILNSDSVLQQLLQACTSTQFYVLHKSVLFIPSPYFAVGSTGPRAESVQSHLKIHLITLMTIIKYFCEDKCKRAMNTSVQ